MKRPEPPSPADKNLTPEEGSVSRGERARLLGQRGITLWFTGLSGSGKSTLARALERALADRGRWVYVLDGDTLRAGLNQDLGFDPAGRSENLRRTAEVARLLTDAGLIVLVAMISPYRRDRAQARAIVGEGSFLEVHVATSLEVCRQRDTKGLYKRAEAGELPSFTGVSAPYEAPTQPDLRLDTSACDLSACLEQLLPAALPEAAS